jgi:hypothetical protein
MKRAVRKIGGSLDSEVVFEVVGRGVSSGRDLRRDGCSKSVGVGFLGMQTDEQGRKKWL